MTTLSEAIQAKGLPAECVLVPFDALRNGRLVRVTAVLKRTAVFEDERPFERHLDLQEMFEVGELKWQELSKVALERAAASARGRANSKRGKAWRTRQGQPWIDPSAARR